MRSLERFGLWWAPLLIGLAPVAGWVPAHRDLVDFFAPMRGATAAVLGAGLAPWLNLANGCGEAWFANPETAVLYPPAWVHLLLPTAWGLAFEVALHLAFFSLAVGLVARQLGCDRKTQILAEVSAWSIGPVLMTVGVLNNLETLTWLPWMLWAGNLRSRLAAPMLAVATALAWLGGEPQLWAIGVVLVVLFSIDRTKAFLGLALGVALVAVQMIPFVFWVIEGDRGPEVADLALRGAVAPMDWLGLLAPGWPAFGGGMVYVESLFIGAPLLCCALLGGWRRKWVLAVSAILAVLATLPGVGAGSLYLALTQGLVRYPSRFALVAVVVLLPLIGIGGKDWLRGRGNGLALSLGLLALGACSVGDDPRRWLVAGIPALVLIASAAAPSRQLLRPAALALGVAATLVAGWPLLGFQSTSEIAVREPVWPEAMDGGRLYSPTPSESDMQWLASGIEARRLWPVGYLNLDQGLVMTRSDSPVIHHRLATHLAITDRGPESRWWLDQLSARWVVLPAGDGLPSGMEEIQRKGGMRLLRNLEARSEVFAAARPPGPDQRPRAAGSVSDLMLQGNRCHADVLMVEEGWLWVSLAPIRGWEWFLDGRTVVLEQGPGIVQFVAVPAGRHRLEGRYRPPGMTTASGISCAAVVCLVLLISLSWRQETRVSVEKGH